MNGSFLWNLIISTMLVGAGLLYIQGWRKQQPVFPAGGSGAAKHVNVKGLIVFFTGLSLLGLALVSPLHAFASRYFSLRALQHLLLIAWAPSLILSSNPWPVFRLAMPAWSSGALSSESSAHRRLKQGWRSISQPGIVWLLFAAVFWLWYDPLMHQATLSYPWVRTIEVLTLFFAAGLYWWHITGAMPRVHPPMPWLLRILYTFVGVVTIKLVGLIVMFAEQRYYFYPNPFQLGGLHLDDQRLGGMVFWVIGGTVFLTTAVLLTRRWLGQEEVKPNLPESTWATDEAMLAPGLRKRM